MNKRTLKRTQMCLVGALILAIVICLYLVFFITKMRTETVTFYSSNSDGNIAAESTTYQTAHDATLGKAVDNISSTLAVGQIQHTNGIYEIGRGYLFFDTSTIPDDATITSATLSIWINTDFSEQDFDITIQNGQPIYPHDPLVIEDYYYSNYSGSGGSQNTSNFILGEYSSITLNETGISWINKTGTTKLCLRSSRDIDSTSPVPDRKEYITVAANEFAIPDKTAKLEITYR